jgi:pimeloyl-ACP methyl ester carboxylesterase
MTMRHRAAFALALICCACASAPSAPDLSAIYERAAKHHDQSRNPVILIPGILGSRLRDSETGRIVWGAFSPGYADPQTPEGARLVALPMREGAVLRDLRDGVVPDGALDRLEVSLLGLPLELGAYRHILGTLGVGGYRDEDLGRSGEIDYGADHFTCFQFDYDWRRDIAENAARLESFIAEKADYVRRERARRYGATGAEVRFDVVAHSMGGLVARYFLAYGGELLPEDGSVPKPTWAGARHLERIVLVGTPNAGSVKALRQLVQGVRFAAILPKYEPAILGTMPSVYELLPRGRHGALVDASAPHEPITDLHDPALWERMGWGLAAADQDRVLRVLLPEVSDPVERRRIALDHLAKCLRRAKQVAEALDAPGLPPRGVEMFLVAGDAVRTEQVAAVDRGTGELRIVGFGPGDGTVLRSSTLLDERVGREWTPDLVSPIAYRQVHFLFTDHLGMTRDPAFTDNLLYLLLEDPRESRRPAPIDVSRARGGASIALP